MAWSLHVAPARRQDHDGYAQTVPVVCTYAILWLYQADVLYLGRLGTTLRSGRSGANPYSLVMSPDGHQVLVGGFGANQVLLIDTTTDQVVGRIPVPMSHNNVLSPDGQMAYVGSQQQEEGARLLAGIAE